MPGTNSRACSRRGGVDFVSTRAIEVRGLVKKFGGVAAVDHVDLTVERGEFLSLLGPSGCGKTTTLRMIGGLESPTEGSIHIGGRDVSGVSPNRRPTSMVFQDYALFPHMSVADNIAFGLKMRGIALAERRRRAEEMLEVVNLAGFGARKPAQLSGGQRQRVALARSLVVEPDVLLLDEPLGALDALIRRQMQSELHRLQRRLGLTFMYVTHDQEEAMAMSDRIVVMHGGRIAQEGVPEDVYRRPRSEFVARFLGECNLIPTTIVKREAPAIVAENALVGRFSVPATRVASGLGPGDRALAAIRPEDIRLGDLPGSIPGKVVERSYLGARTRYVIDVGGATIVAAEQSSGATVGEEVGIWWPEDAVSLVTPDSGSTPAGETRR
ncbi:MAG: ABC transporter ATP-binding protein [Thermomicrobiales bacterium]|nr:ABC transporter ATP-binding protein [Thermomicrobiales bacterium]